MRPFGILMLCCVCLGFGATAAAASGRSVHKGAPYWSRAQADDRVSIGDITADGRSVRISQVTCFGTGTTRLKVRGVYKYQHFNCLITPARERAFWIRVHTLARGWTYQFLHYA